MQPSDKPPPRRTLIDQVAYGLCIVIIWATALGAVLAG
jgi:hypothetical protein